MRKPLMVGNWKMNKTRDEALQFIFAINQELPDFSEVETVVCAQSVLLRCLVKRQGEELKIGAQNMHFEDSGAFTGEVSPVVLQDTGVKYVIIGHSERRAMFNETDDSVNKKVISALKHDLTPIICCGETLELRNANKVNLHITNQITNAFKNINKEDAIQTVIAYEPIWAIGTGVSATPDIVEEVCLLIRNIIKELYDEVTANAIRILYGGSVNPKNIDNLMKKENIDGALVGGASLEAESFLRLVKACK